MEENEKTPAIDRSILPLDEEKDVLDKINRQVDRHPVVKSKHNKWKELIAWGDEGRQFEEYGDGGMAPVTFQRRSKKVVINLMKPLGEAIEGKINMFYQVAGVPNSGEDKDVQSSKAATKINAHIDYDNKIESMNEDVKYDLRSTGNAFRKWIYDKDYPAMGRKGKMKGGVKGSVPSVFHVRPDPTGKIRDDWRWLVELIEVTEDEILEKFKNVTKEILKEAVGEGRNEADKFVGMNEPIEDKDREEATHIVAYYWEKATKKYPEGRLIIAITGTNIVLWAKKNKPGLGEIPYFHYGYKRSGNSMWHTGPYQHVQPIQREINRTVSIISEHHEGWRAKMAAAPGAVIKDGAFTEDSFEILEVDLTKGDIKPVVMPELSPQITAYRDYLMTAFNLVSNVHEVSYSQLPKYASRAPATLFSMMLEQENMKLDPMVKRMNQTVLDEAKFKLRLAKEYYKTERLISIVGENRKAQVEYFKGADLDGHFDVKLEIGISLNQSRTVKQRLLLELKQMGAPIDWNKVFRLLEEGDVSEELREDIADETRATRENQSFINETWNKPFKDGGIMIYVHDNHEIHLDKHTDLMKSEEVQKWKPEAIAALDAHTNNHWALFMEQMKMQMKMMMQAQQEQQGQGQGGSPVGGSPPANPQMM